MTYSIPSSKQRTHNPLHSTLSFSSKERHKSIYVKTFENADFIDPIVPPIAPLKINHKNNNNSRPEAAAGKKPHARFGATRQDRHGEWWVLVLADGQWHRSREMGLVPPGGV